MMEHENGQDVGNISAAFESIGGGSAYEDLRHVTLIEYCDKLSKFKS